MAIHALKVLVLLGMAAAALANKDERNVNVKDPKSVATTFVLMLKDHRFKEILAIVYPPHRPRFSAEELERSLKKFPPIPEKPVIKIELTREGKRANAKVPNWDKKVGIELRYSDDQWWIEY